MPVDISEYESLSQDSLGSRVPTGSEPARAFNQVAVGAGSVQSPVFGDNTRFVRVHTDVACRVSFGTNPTASATTMRLAPNSTEFFGVRPGHRLAVITSS